MIKIGAFCLGLLSLSCGCLAAGLAGVDSDELQSLLNGGAVVVDVRTPKEWQETGIIPGSHPLTFFDATGHYDKAAWLKSLKPLLAKPDQALVLVCRSGNRSAIAGKYLADEAGFERVYHLERGIRAWAAESRPLQPPPCPYVLPCTATTPRSGGAAP